MSWFSSLGNVNIKKYAMITISHYFPKEKVWRMVVRAAEKVQHLRECIALAEEMIQFQAATWSHSQPSITPENIVSSPDPYGNLHSQAYKLPPTYTI